MSGDTGAFLLVRCATCHIPGAMFILFPPSKTKSEIDLRQVRSRIADGILIMYPYIEMLRRESLYLAGRRAAWLLPCGSGWGRIVYDSFGSVDPSISSELWLGRRRGNFSCQSFNVGRKERKGQLRKWGVRV